MELFDNLERGYKDVLKWASTPTGVRTLRMAAVFVLALSLAFGIGYLSGRSSNQAPIIIQT